MSKESATTSNRVNVRRPEVLDLVQEQVENHYRSTLVERIRTAGGEISLGSTHLRLARQFGFCYGVERAIDLAYAARKVFPDNNIYLIGEIIHNPEVNRQLKAMGVGNLTGPEKVKDYSELNEEDVVIVPAFGAETSVMSILKERGVKIVDTTCGDVMSVWKRVRNYAKEQRTSIIHGKATHEETRSTASRALGDSGNGHYLVLLTLSEVDYVCDYIKNGGDRDLFLKKFANNMSEGFDPDLHLKRIGVANQTTMLKSETEEVQRRIQAAVTVRDGNEKAQENFSVFDTICGATQERQDSLFEMLRKPLDMLLVVGGYNSSNTTHLVEIGQQQLPSFFIRDADCLKSLDQIIHFDLHQKSEIAPYTNLLDIKKPVTIGITAGASCPNNLVENTIRRVFELRGHSIEEIDRLIDGDASALGS